MKKFMVIALSLTLLLTSSCSQKKEENKEKSDNKEQVMKIDSKQAKTFIDNYLRYVLKGDATVLPSYYTEKLKIAVKDIKMATNPRPVGYTVEEGETDKNKAEFKVTIFNAHDTIPYYSADFFKYAVVLDKDKMLIDAIDKENSIEIYEQDKTLFKRDKDSGKGIKVFTLKDLPTFVYSKESVREQKYQVYKDKFGPCAISQDGKSIAVSSIGKNSYVGYVKLEESKETFNESTKIAQGDEKKKDSSQSGEEQGQQQQNQQNEEEKIKFTTKDIDYYFDSIINSVIFSPSGKNLVVEIKDKLGMSYINFYKTTGEKMDLKLESRFQRGRFSLTKAYFVSDSEVVFSVVPAKDATEEEVKLKGEWTIDLEKGEISQIK